MAETMNIRLGFEPFLPTIIWAALLLWPNIGISADVLLSDLIEEAGYIYAEEAAAATPYDDNAVIVRAYEDEEYLRESILLVRDGQISVLEESRYAGEAIFFEIVDLNQDGTKDIVIVENFDDWSVRVHLSNSDSGLALDVVSALRPTIVDLSYDGKMELVTTSNLYGYDNAITFVPTVYVLRGNKYEEADTIQ